MQINVDLIYPIGSLYLTTSTVSPAVLFGGTWERLTADAYLKIVNTELELGQLGGTSSDHKIPLLSIPEHDHQQWSYSWKSSNDIQPGSDNTHRGLTWAFNDRTGTAGGSQPYYPYYYGIYVWRRTT